ncbi:YggS family pyridoxal phosphate-dependent enzyme [Senegalia massiliensis]|uniref:Pyridoxal phosphate homeostasis protein n=1 Tax=Senegalia massiliensis TaxID=1720316 RepID=A0A845QZI0_9CLOT|nr:YggS family pyridoxal phosphate-dependent enzyme [Senegalia massiliensis]
MSIKENIKIIEQKIQDACDRSNRNRSDVKLIAVTKTQSIESIEEIIDSGLYDIGENKVQEIMDKYDSLNREELNWHMIGHLQSNKVKYIIDKMNLFHSLDRLSLAKELNKRARKSDRVVDVLIQVNIAEEESKFGMKKQDIWNFIESLKKYPFIAVKGLMVMAPFDEEPENIRYVFKEAKSLFEDIKKKEIPYIDMKYLSMGMTNDFEIAIEEGANLVRVGTGIFGKRK